MMEQVADPKRVFYFTKKASKTLYEVKFQPGDWLVFGKETTGLDEKLLREVESQTVRIPLLGPVRSLNLSNAVSIATYEALRQTVLLNYSNSSISMKHLGYNGDFDKTL